MGYPLVRGLFMHFGCVDMCIYYVLLYFINMLLILGNMYISEDILYLINWPLIRYLHIIMVRNHAGNQSAADSH